MMSPGTRNNCGVNSRCDRSRGVRSHRNRRTINLAYTRTWATLGIRGPFRLAWPERLPMLQRSVFQAADALADVLAPSRGPLSADQLIALARRRAGLTEFGETPFSDLRQNFLHAG